MSRFFVSGSNLQWIDGKALVTRSICGAIPDPVPSGFGGQPPGRVWVASDHRDDNLYYSDGGGQTRFIEGIDKGVDNTIPLGRVYTNQDCASPIELWWATPSGSDILIRSARADNVRESFIQTAVWRWTYGAFDVGGSNTASLIYTGDNRGNNNLTNAVTVAGTTINVYNDLTACNANGATFAVINPGSLTLTASTAYLGLTTIGVNATNYDNKYFRLETGSNIVATVDGNNYSPFQNPLCNGTINPVDYITVRFYADGRDPGVCYLARTSAQPNNTCNRTCFTGPAGPDNTAECSGSSDGCSTCSGQQGVNGGQGVCYNGSTPPPPPPPPPGGGFCGASCTPKNASTTCGGGCTVCCNGTCASKCPE